MALSVAAPSPTSTSASRAPWWRDALFPLGLWLVTRLALLYVGYLSLAIVPHLVKPGGSPGLHSWPALDALCRWDCGWFDLLARRGYRTATETNFWPALPYLVRGLHALTGLPEGLGVLVVPNLACLAAYVIIHRLFREAAGPAAADSALIVFAAYPFAFFHASGYPETLMIACSAAAMLLAQRGRHVAAGASLGLGILSRHLTVLMGAGLLAAQVRERGWKRLLLSPRILTLAVPFLIAGVYSFYCWRAWHDPLSFLHARDAWGSTAWWSAAQVLAHAKDRPHIVLFMPFALLPTVGALALVTRARERAVLLWAVLPLVVVLWLIGAFGLGRYSASCWPAFLPLGEWLERHPRWKVPLVIVLGLAQGWFFFLHVHHYEIQ